MQLPLIPSQDQSIQLLQTRWASLLNPLLANDGPFTSGKMLFGVALINGSTRIPHTLGRVQQGWIITDNTASATIYRDGNTGFNSEYFTLISNAVTVLNVWVF